MEKASFWGEKFLKDNKEAADYQKPYGIVIYPKGNPKVVYEGKHFYVWHEGTKDKPKTKVFDVYNYGNDFLGEIQWLGTWRQYAFKIDFTKFKRDEVLWFGGSCFTEIHDFCRKQTEAQRKSTFSK